MIPSTNLADIKQLLDNRVLQYNRIDFIHSDPIQVPRRFSLQNDIEIAGFLTATISWGQRKSIINNALRLMDMMDNSPYDFLLQADSNDWQRVSKFVHRTFNGYDCLFFL